jgi:hypothetical protein
MNSGEVLLHQALQHLLIDQSTEHGRDIAARHVPLTQHREQKETLFLFDEE